MRFQRSMLWLDSARSRAHRKQQSKLQLRKKLRQAASSWLHFGGVARFWQGAIQCNFFAASPSRHPRPQDSFTATTAQPMTPVAPLTAGYADVPGSAAAGFSGGGGCADGNRSDRISTIFETEKEVLIFKLKLQSVNKFLQESFVLLLLGVWFNICLDIISPFLKSKTKFRVFFKETIAK